MSFKIRLVPDDYHLQEVGRLSSGASCWIDLQFSWTEGATRDFVAAYVFDSDGRLIWSDIQDLGLRGQPGQKSPKDAIREIKAKIGEIESCEIWVSPFTVDARGLKFGLIVRTPDEEDDSDYLAALAENGPLVDAMPGHTMMFYPPWEEGLFDT